MCTLFNRFNLFRQMSTSGQIDGEDAIEANADDESLAGIASAPGSIKEEQDFELQREDSKDDSRDADVSSGEEMDKKTARKGDELIFFSIAG